MKRAALLAAACLAGCASQDGRPPGGEEGPPVAAMRLPAGAEHCAAAADREGGIHAVYEKSGDVFYVHAPPGGTFSFPLRVNPAAGSTPNSQGPLKRPDIALDHGGKVHVVWGAGWASSGRKYVNYASLYGEGEGFSPARAFDIPSYSWAVAADSTGNVTVFHNADNLLFSLSSDRGERFSRGLDAGAPKACPNSALAAVFSGEDFLYCAYQAAGTDGGNRPCVLIGPRGLGEFGFRDLGWTSRPSAACAEAKFSLCALESGVAAAWSAGGMVWWNRLDRWGRAEVPGDSRTFAMTADWPCIVADARGGFLVAWKEGSRIAWQYQAPGSGMGGGVGGRLGSGLGRFAGLRGPGESFLLID